MRAFKIQERELSFLTPEQITQLLGSLDKSKNRSVRLIARVFLETGARWGEAEQLRTAQVRNGVIQFSVAKSKKNRSVRVREDLEKSLQAHYKEHGSGERYFPHAAHEWAFREAVEAAGLVLKEGQLTHVLRHTFASHFMMNRGNILALKKFLGTKA